DYRIALTSIPLPAMASRVTLAPLGDGPVDLAATGLEPERRGVRVLSFGFPGAQASILDRWQFDNIAFQLRRLAPSLLIVAFGTNEGFQVAERLEGYGPAFDRRTALLRRGAPDASLVIVGSPAAHRLPRHCALTPEAQDLAPCSPLSASERARYDLMMARADPALCRWHTPAALTTIRADQAAAAKRLGATFWDWSALMPSECGLDDWYRRSLAHRDRVHLRQDGYWRSADDLLAHLLNGAR
ncbi:MAG TPA: hypothetical protein PK264_09895, partial [Hyphomicrobiaceae bacterium]|nr:hypothetical protein [Hyphomicrobiaceae bacterium]